MVQRHVDEDYNPGIVSRMGMPVLYIMATLSALTGIITMSIITHYWAEKTHPICFLYMPTTSSSENYTPGSNISNCYWVAFGSIPSVILLIICGFVYFYMVAGTRTGLKSLSFVLIGMLIATILLLAVSCTLTEGMRITCNSMGLNGYNNKQSCYEKLDQREVPLKTMPVLTSTMIAVSSGCLWAATACSFILLCFHILSFNRRTLKSKQKFRQGY